MAEAVAAIRDEPAGDRRTRIAAAAVAVLASHGSRGLTHRAVDRHLGLPAGSTSAYFRTRSALLDAAAAWLVERDRADIDAAGTDAAGMMSVLETWLEPVNRARLRARFELFLAPGAGDESRLADARRSILAGVAARLRSAGAVDPDVAALTVVSLSEGLLLDAMMGGPSTVAQRRAVISAVWPTPIDSTTDRPSR